MSVTARYAIGREKARRRTLISAWLTGDVPTTTDVDDCTLHPSNPADQARTPAVCLRCARQIEQRGMRC